VRRAPGRIRPRGIVELETRARRQRPLTRIPRASRTSKPRRSARMADERAPETNGGETEPRKGAPQAEAPPDPKKSKKMRLRVIAGVVVAGIVVLVWWLHARKF